MTRCIRQIGLIFFGLMFSVTAAPAQSSVYITGSGFADIKTFSGTDGNLYGGGSSDLDGTSAGGGVRIGTFLHPRWSLELAIDTGGKTEGSDRFPIILADITSVSRVPELKQSVRFLTVGTVVGFHPAARGRFHPGYLAGFSFVRGTYKSRVPSYYTIAADLLNSTTRLSSVFPTIFPPPVLSFDDVTTTENTSGVVLGFETAIDVGQKLAIVPEVRALAFSQRGAGAFLIRPGVSVRWSF
jgi:hypothetical protein